MSYQLSSDFIDQDLERGLIAAADTDPDVLTQLTSTLGAQDFAAEAEAWGRLQDDASAVPDEWTPTADPSGDADRLLELTQRRQLATSIEQASHALYADDDDVSAAAVAEQLRRGLDPVAEPSEAPTSTVLSGDALIAEMLRYAQRQHDLRAASDSGLIGIPTGLDALDDRLGGLQGQRVYTLAGAPGQGKTTLAIQIATHAASVAPVVYVSFENDAVNLSLKSMSAGRLTGDGTRIQDVTRGHANLEELKLSAEDWRSTAERLTIVPGSPSLTTTQLEAICRQAMETAASDRCLLAIDYLQTWAAGAKEFSGYASAKERIDALTAAIRGISRSLDIPVLVLAAQNRAGGNYGGRGSGGTGLDSLKGSGEIEYDADAVLILIPGDTIASGTTLARKLVIAKNRHGATDAIDLVFYPAEGRMRERAEIDASAINPF